MCGRFAFYSAHEAMPALFPLENPQAIVASYNIAPTDNAAIFRLNTGTNRLRVSMARWGLVPFWAKDIAIGNKLINARAETAHEKPSFRAAYKQRRCLIPVDGFYEWCSEDGAKQPYYISARSGEPFCFGGLWESWSPPEGDPLETFTILTRAPNAYIAGLHRRMPVVVSEADYQPWLSGAIGVSGNDTPLAETPNDVLVAWPVSKRVNSPRNNEDNLIEASGKPV